MSSLLDKTQELSSHSSFCDKTYFDEKIASNPIDKWHDLLNPTLLETLTPKHKLCTDVHKLKTGEGQIPLRINSENCWSQFDAQQCYIKTKPACFIILGKPTADSSLLGNKIADHWNCIHISPDTVIEEQIRINSDCGKCIKFNMMCGKVIGCHVILKLIKEKLASDVVKHRGYVVSGLPLIGINFGDICKPERLYSEEAYFSAQDILHEILEKSDFDMQVNNNEIAGEDDENREDEAKDQELVVEEERVNTDEQDVNIRPTGFVINYDTPFSGIISEDEEVVMKLEDQLQMIFESPMMPDIIINIKCSVYDTVSKRGQYRLIYPDNDCTMLAFPSTHMKSKEEPSVAYQSSKINKFSIKRICDMPKCVYMQCKLYKRVIRPIINHYILLHNPQNVIKLDGRCEFTTLLEAVTMKLSTLTLPRALLPKVYADLNGKDDIPPDDGENAETSMAPSAFLESVGRNKILSRFPLSESPWGIKCPVALSEGKCVKGFSDLAAVFFENVFLFSSPAAMLSFCRNPRPYLKAESLVPTCRIVILGPNLSGKSTLAKCLSWILNGKIIDFHTLKTNYRKMKMNKIIQNTENEAITLANEARNSVWLAKETERLHDFDYWVFEKLKLMKDFIRLRNLFNSDEYISKTPDPNVSLFENTKASLRNTFGYDLEDSIIGSICEETISHKETLLFYMPRELTESFPLNEAQLGDKDVSQIIDDLVAADNRYELHVSEDDFAFELIDEMKTIENEFKDNKSTGKIYGGWIIDNMTCDLDTWNNLKTLDYLPDDVFCLFDESNIDYDLFLKLTKRSRNSGKMVKHIFDQLDDPLAKTQESFSELSNKSDVLADISRKMDGIIDSDYFDKCVWGEVTSNTECIPLEDVYAADFSTFSEQLNKFNEDLANLKPFMEGLEMEPIEIPIMNLDTPTELLSVALRKLRYRYGALCKSNNTEEKNAENTENIQSDIVNVGSILGETGIYCPVTFRRYNGLLRGKVEFSTKYKEQVYFIANEQALADFQLDPEKFLQIERPFVSFPARRICVVGPPGSGCTSVAKILAERMDLIYIDFVNFTLSEYSLPDQNFSRNKFDWLNEIEANLSMQYDEEKITNYSKTRISDIETNLNTGDNENEEAEDVPIDSPQRFKDYFIQNADLDQAVLGNLLSKLWFVEPFSTRGIVVDGFPRTALDMDYMKELSMFPDLVVEMVLNTPIILRRLLPSYSARWKESQSSIMQKYHAQNDKLLENRNSYREARIVVFQIMYTFQRQFFFSIKSRSVKFEDGADQEDAIDDKKSSGDNINLRDTEELKSLEAITSVLSIDLEADEEALLAAIEEIDSQFPEPELFSEWEDVESAEQRIKTNLEEWCQLDLDSIAISKESAAMDLIPWMQLKSNVTYKKMKRNILTLTSDLGNRNESLFEQTFTFGVSQAKELIDKGYAFLSKFGVICPVRVFELEAYVPTFIPDLIAQIAYPVMHRKFMYFCSGQDNLKKFISNPLKYVQSPDINNILPLPLKVAIVGPPKCGKTTLSRRFEKEWEVRVLGLGKAIKSILAEAPWTITAKKIIRALSQGQTVPHHLAVDALHYSFLDGKFLTQGFILDGIPQNIQEAIALTDAGLFPYTIINLECESDLCLEYLKNLPPQFSEDMPTYSTKFILHMYDKYTESKIPFDRFIRYECQNDEKIPASQSKWKCWWDAKSIALKYLKDIQKYLMSDPENPVNLLRLCITPAEFDRRSSDLKDYCPTCRLENFLINSGRPLVREGLIQYKNLLLWLCEKHLPEFLHDPITLPESLPEHLPVRLTDLEMIPPARDDKKVHGGGRCIVTFADNYPTRKVVHGNPDLALLYMHHIYFFADEMALEKFMSEPEKYFDIKIHLDEVLPPMDLRQLSNLGYLEQFLSDMLIKAIIKTSRVRPKYPGLSPELSAGIHIGFFLKLNNPKTNPACLQMYEHMSSVFDERCGIVKYVGTSMRRRDNPHLPAERHCCKPFSEPSVHFLTPSSSSGVRASVIHNTPVSSPRSSKMQSEYETPRTSPKQFSESSTAEEAFEKTPSLVTYFGSSRRVPVPDERFDYLCTFHKPMSKVPAFLNITDIAGLVKGASEGQGLGNAFLSHIKACDAIFHLCRAFEDDDVIHVEGDVNPVRDLEIIGEELRLKDEEALMVNLDKLEKTVGRGSDKKLKPEYDALNRIKAHLVDEKKHIRFGDWSLADIDILNKYLFLTSKPAMYLVNLSEKDYIRKKNKWLLKLKEWVDKNDPGAMIIPFSGVFENKLADMEPPEKAAYLKDNNITSALDKIIVSGYKALQLEYFFTAGPDEVKAWTVQKGTKAPQAAGRIHTDFEKGFIMAEVMHFKDFKEEGTEAAAKAAGKYRQQGRNYTVEDGDIIFFKFNAGAGLKDPKKK